LRIALLGAFGQLGRDLQSALVSHEVVPLGRADFDVRDIRAARGRLTEIQPDAIVNTTAFHKVELCEEEPDTAFAVNATAPARLAGLARELSALFVHVSTDYVYGGTDVRPLTELVPPAPVQVHGASKLAGEWLVQLANPEALVVRSSGLFGVAGASGKGGNFIQTVMRLAREKGEMRIVDDQFLSPTFTPDLAGAIGTLLERRVTGLIHVTNSDSCSWYQLACHIVASAGLRASVRPVSTPEFGATVRRPAYSVLENARWRALALPPLRSWREAVLAYLRAKGVLESGGTVAGAKA
jgi:dTDP-4-dehydrorhamnose reductase